MKVIFDKLAKKELDDSIEYYEIEIKGLGIRFREEIKRSLRIIKKMPKIGSPESENVRRYILHMQNPAHLEHQILRKSNTQSCGARTANPGRPEHFFKANRIQCSSKSGFQPLF